MRLLAAALACLLTACGGGSSDSPTTTPPASPPPAQSVTAGRYSLSSEPAYLVTNGTDVIYVSRTAMGFGQWSQGSASMQMLNRLVDDIGNEFPIAKELSETRSISSGVAIENNHTAPDLTTIPNNWRFTLRYQFDGKFLDYSAEIAIDPTGGLTGSDSNGCVFTGKLTRRTDAPLYDARIAASNCGATMQYIEGLEYTGFAFTRPGASPDSTVLEIIGVNRTRQIGIAFNLFAQ